MKLNEIKETKQFSVIITTKLGDKEVFHNSKKEAEDFKDYMNKSASDLFWNIRIKKNF